MSQPTPPSRPWYCNDHLVEDWLTVEREGGDLKMLRSLKIIRSILVNIGVIAVALLSIWSGAEPTLVGTTALVVLGGFNGVEAADYAALAQAVAEVRAEKRDKQDDTEE